MEVRKFADKNDKTFSVLADIELSNLSRWGLKDKCLPIGTQTPLERGSRQLRGK